MDRSYRPLPHMPGAAGFVMATASRQISELPSRPSNPPNLGKSSAMRVLPKVQNVTYPDASLGGLATELKTMIFESIRSRVSLKAIGFVCRDFHEIVQRLLPRTYNLTIEDVFPDGTEVRAWFSGAPQRISECRTLPCNVRLKVTVFGIPSQLDSRYYQTQDEGASHRDNCMETAFLRLPPDRFGEVIIENVAPPSYRGISTANILLLLQTQTKVRHLELPSVYYRDGVVDPEYAQALGKLESLAINLEATGSDFDAWVSVLSTCSHAPALSVEMDHRSKDMRASYKDAFASLQQPTISDNIVKLTIDLFWYDGVGTNIHLRLPHLKTLSLEILQNCHKIFDSLEKTPQLSALMIGSIECGRHVAQLRASINTFLSRPFRLREFVMHIQPDLLPDASVVALHGPSLRALEVFGHRQAVRVGDATHYKVEDLMTIMRACTNLAHLAIEVPHFLHDWEKVFPPPIPPSEGIAYLDKLWTALVAAPSINSMVFRATSNIPPTEWSPYSQTQRRLWEDCLKSVAGSFHAALRTASGVSPVCHVPRLLGLSFFHYERDYHHGVTGRYALPVNGIGELKGLEACNWKDALAECDEDWMDFELTQYFWKGHQHLM